MVKFHRLCFPIFSDSEQAWYRIISRRFSVINLYEDRLEKGIVEKMYKNNHGGCVVFKVARASEDIF